jgi:hypothetical protein
VEARSSRGAELDPASVGAIEAPKDSEQLAISNGQYRPQGDYFGLGQSAPPRAGERPVNFPRYWIRPPLELRTTRGFHRFVWDLHHTTPRAIAPSYPIAAIYLDTEAKPQGPWALPGKYTARLAVDGNTQQQPLVLMMDPRVKTAASALRQQFALSMQLVDVINRAIDRVSALREQRREGDPTPDEAAWLRMHGEAMSVYHLLQDSDEPPTTQAIAAARDVLQRAAAIK